MLGNADDVRFLPDTLSAQRYKQIETALQTLESAAHKVAAGATEIPGNRMQHSSECERVDSQRIVHWQTLKTFASRR